MKPVIEKLTANLCGGATHQTAARECYALEQQLGIPVNFIHNGCTFSVSLEIKQVAGPPMPEAR